MLVLCVIFALLAVGLVVPCVIDVATTPSHHFDLPSKQTWLIVVIAFWAFGAAGWLLLGRREVRMHQLWDDMTGDWSGARRGSAASRWPRGRTGAGVLAPQHAAWTAGRDRPGSLRRP